MARRRSSRKRSGFSAASLMKYAFIAIIIIFGASLTVILFMNPQLLSSVHQNQTQSTPSGQVIMTVQIQDRESLSLVTGATIYAKRADGTIITFSEDTNSPGTYLYKGVNIGENLLLLIKKDGYYPAVYSVTADEPNTATGEYSAGVLQISRESVSVSMLATIGAATVTTQINTTALNIGSQFTMGLIISNNDKYSVFGNSYDDFKTGKSYIGPLLVIKVNPLVINVASVSGDHAVLKYSFSIGSDQYYVYQFSPLVNNPDNSSAVQSVSLTITFNVLSTGTDALSIYTYGMCNETVITAGQFGTAAASLAGIDIVS